MRITAIFSDYDGTLCPTRSIINKERNFISPDLENNLWKISDKIPVCIVSSKDFTFLHSRTKFACIISCILGIETLILRRHEKQMISDTTRLDYTKWKRLECSMDYSCVKGGYLLPSSKLLENNSQIMAELADEIVLKFEDVTVEKKFTIIDKSFLAGITIDWRHRKDWHSFKSDSEPLLNKTIQDKDHQKQSKEPELYVQTYSTHPFIDVYNTSCDKGKAFDYIVSQIPYTRRKSQNIMYLGDSENDNPAFRKAGVSIGVHSDRRLRPQLDCKYHVDFDYLSIFLKALLENDLEFSESLL